MLSSVPVNFHSNIATLADQPTKRCSVLMNRDETR